MAAKETAEQKLLKLIETPSVAPVPAREPGPEAGSFHSAVSSIRGFFIHGWPLSRGMRLSAFGLNEINKILLGIGLVIGIYLLVDFGAGMNALHKKNQFMVDARLGKIPEISLPGPRDLSNYLAPVETRNIFKPYEKKTQTVEPAVTPSGVPSASQKVKLVGISWQDSSGSSSVMIEDTEGGITYFLREGEAVKGMTVKTIYTDRVILFSDSGETTLWL